MFLTRVVCPIVLIVAVPVTATAQTGLFEDHFDDGTMSAEWISLKPEQWVENGWLHVRNPSCCSQRDTSIVAHDGDTSWTDYTLHLIVDPLPTRGAWTDLLDMAAVHFRTRESEPVGIGRGVVGYQLNIVGPDNHPANGGPNGVFLSKTLEPTCWGVPDCPRSEFRHELSYPVPAGPMEVEIRVEGARIRISIDGDLLFDVIDTEPEGPFLYGGIGLSNLWEAEARYDDVEVIGSGFFSESGRSATGTDPFAVTAGDLDNDGDIDLATANHGSANLSVLLNDGDGVFTEEVTYRTGTEPWDIASGDLDGDDDLDLAVPNLNDATVSVFLNHGDGTYAADVAYATGDAPIAVTTADIDGDDDLDLVVANGFEETVSVLRNNGNGTFASHVAYGVGAAPLCVIAGDLDGDDDLDLAVANSNGDNVSVLRNHGNGTFANDVLYGVGDDPYSVAPGDLDADGDLDLLVANRGSDDVSILLNNGNGTFADQFTVAAGLGPIGIATGDLDGDDDLDLAVANSAGDDVSVMLNQDYDTTYTVGDQPRSVVTADLDGDGDLDLAVANAGSDDVSILLNTTTCAGDPSGDGTADVQDLQLILALWGPCEDGCLGADVDHSGVVDVADLLIVLAAWGPCGR